MTNQELYEQFCKTQLEIFTQSIQDAAKDAIQSISYAYLPYVADDTDANVSIIVNQVLANILRGDYQVKDGYLTTNSPYSFVSLKITPYQWDELRTEFIKLMPVCPKDVEILALKEQIKSLKQRGFC